MSTREEKALEYFANGNSYNCAQSVLGVFCEENGLDKNVAFKIANGFGGGVRNGDVCGAVSGAVMVIGLKCGFFVEKDFAQKGFCYRKTEEFLHEFKKENGSTICRDLLGVDIRSSEDFRKPEVRELIDTVCPRMVASAVHILEQMDFNQTN